MSITSIVLMAFVISTITVVSNIFDYDYYNDIKENDYLESNHNAEIEYNAEKWKLLKELKKNDSYNPKLIKETQYDLEYLVTFDLLKGQLNSKLTFKHIENKILIEIKKTPISFLPDKAKNYKILRKIIRDLKTKSNNSYN